MEKPFDEPSGPSSENPEMKDCERPNQPSPGFLVTFEGIEGSGKSTQLGLLADHLIGRGQRVLKTREPGGTLLGDRVRSLLLDPAFPKIVPKAELYLILASRAQHVAEVIRPAILEGRIVLCDRFIHATIAYQGYGRGLEIDFVEAASLPASDQVTPRLVFLLDLDVSVALDRLAQRGQMNRIDRERAEFHESVRRGYLLMAEKAPRTFRRIDAARPFDVVAQEIQKEFHNRLDPQHV